MKAFVLFAAAALIVIPANRAQGAVHTVGGALSNICYKSAQAGDGRTLALEGCTRALDEESLSRADLAATYVNRGIVLMNGGRFSDADADFDAALRIANMLPDGWLNKGFLRLRQGDGRAALPLIQRGIEAGAGNQAIAIFARAVAYEQMGEVALAYSDLRRARWHRSGACRAIIWRPIGCSANPSPIVG